MELLPDDHVVVPACDQVTIAGHAEVDRRKEIEHDGDDQHQAEEREAARHGEVGQRESGDDLDGDCDSQQRGGRQIAASERKAQAREHQRGDNQLHVAVIERHREIRHDDQERDRPDLGAVVGQPGVHRRDRRDRERDCRCIEKMPNPRRHWIRSERQRREGKDEER